MSDKKSNITSYDGLDDCILYELLVYSEWKQDPELLKFPNTNLFGGNTVWRTVQVFSKRVSVCDQIQRLIKLQLPWHFAVGEGGKVVAILQDTILEIRTSRDEYSSIIGKASIARDSAPQLRRLAWSPDCSMLAVAYSNGVVSFYDLLGSNIFNIYPPKFQADVQNINNKQTLIFISFIQSRRKSPKWSAEFISVDYEGQLCCYLVSPTEGYQQSHTFSFSHYYRQGIQAVSYHPSHNMLFVAGPANLRNVDVVKGHGSSVGLSAWRLLNDLPHYRLALSTDEEQAIWKAQNSWSNWVPSITSKPAQSLVFKMQVSPSGMFMACLHSCGSISVWHLPAIRLYRHWSLQEQPDFNVRNPQLTEFGDKRQYDASCFYPVDINWWSDHAMIIARRSGAVSVCSVDSLRNLLGESPEFLAGPPQVSALCSDQGFLGLECEAVLTSNKWNWDDHTGGSEDEDDDADDDEDATLLNKSMSVVQSAVFAVTDMERFQPKRRRPKLCHKTYRLLGLKSTTPEELYARKIDNEEYGEALALAKAYGLDCDLVYQQQWRNSKMCIATIHDYLSKVSKRLWVLRECIERVPETFSAVRELLQFGLERTNMDTLTGEGDEGADKDRDELLAYRFQLLQYFDRLCTYELILGGASMAGDSYDSTFYGKFRTEPLIKSAVKFAQESNWQAVEIMFTYHGDIILPHWLPVLSNFPETLNPYEYRSLLPECSTDGEVFVWNQCKLREEDWCERNRSDRDDGDAVAWLYEEDSSLKQFSCDEPDGLTVELVTAWYRSRVHQIEHLSCMVDNALMFIKLARERNILGLDDLYNQLLTLDTLIYEVHIDTVGLTDLQKMSDLEVCRLLMSKSGEATFVEDLKCVLLPFLLRRERHTPGSRKQLLHDFLTDRSSQDLSLPVKLFQHLHADDSSSLVTSVEEKTKLALSCVYAYPHADQLHKAFQIMEGISDYGYECDFHAAEILKHNQLPRPLSFIRDCKNNPDTVQQLLIKLARSYIKRVPATTEGEWKQLFTDMLALQATCFQCISVELCYEIYASTLLASGKKKNIEAAADIMECEEKRWNGKLVPYKKTVKLVLLAALEYFGSAGSLNDPLMSLAKLCLAVIIDKSEEVTELLDLIDALQLLNDFGVNMLPLQVRICSERLRLIESCLSAKPTAYRSTQRLMQLASKLRVCGDDTRQREGRVLVLIAQTALQHRDYQACAELCQQLVQKQHMIGWEVVRVLGQCDRFNNPDLKRDLLSFALLHCPADMLEELIQTRCGLEVQQLRHKMKVNQMLRDEEEFSDALTSPLTPSRDVAAASPVKTPTSESSQGEDNPFLLQGFPTFYKSLAPNSHTSNLSTQYDKFSPHEIADPDIQLSQAQLRTILLEQSGLTNCANVLVQHAAYLLNEDTAAGLGHLLALSDDCQAESCFMNLPRTSLTLQLAMYYYALQEYQQVELVVTDLYLASPCRLIEHVIANVEKQEQRSSREELLLKYRHLMEELLEGEQLQELGCGVDLQRFTQDEQYRQDSILGLAMTVDPEKLRFAVKLGTRRRIDIGEIAARHVTTLLLNSDTTSLSDMSAHLADPDICQLLSTSPTTLCNRLEQLAYPSISGTDHQLLLCYYSVMHSADPQFISHNLSAKEHLKLLRKVKTTSSDIDYKKLVNSPANIIEVVLPALERNNVGLIAKLLKSFQHNVQLGELYAAWALKEFFKTPPVTSVEVWMEQYKLCSTHFNKMAATDILKFVRGVCFSEQGVDALPADCRAAIVAKVIQYCQQETTENQSELSDELRLTLELWLVHLRALTSPDAIKFSNSSGQESRRLLRLFDLSMGEPEETQKLLESAVMSHIPSDSLSYLVAFLPTQLKTLEDCLLHLMRRGCNQARSGAGSELLSAVLSRMRDEGIVPQEVESLCVDTTLSSEVRLQALDLLQGSRPQALQENVTLLFRHTQAVLATSWSQSDIQISESDMASPASRVNLFLRLLKQANSWQHLLALKELLSKWPPIGESDISGGISGHPWLQLLYQLLTCEDRDVAVLERELDDIFQQVNFSPSMLQELVSRCEGSADLSLLLLVCLLPKQTSLNTTVAGLIRKHIHAENAPLSTRLISLLFERGLAPSLVATPVYAQILEHLMLSCNRDLPTLASQLIDAGHLAEAGTVRLLHMGVSPALSLFSPSLILARTASPEE